MNEEKKRANDLAQLKGASAWLTSLPIKDEGFVLNKREFFDAVAMRYRWDMKRLPLNCSCGKQFTMDHAMQCPLGQGFPNPNFYGGAARPPQRPPLYRKSAARAT